MLYANDIDMGQIINVFLSPVKRKLSSGRL